MPTIDPTPPSVRIESTSDQIASLLKRPEMRWVSVGPVQVPV
jgi:hypothetical protein